MAHNFSSVLSRQPGKKCWCLGAWWQLLFALNYAYQFFLSYLSVHVDTHTHTRACTHRLDGKHVVFGKVIDGMDVIKQVEGYGSESGKTSKKIVVSDCGQLS